MTPYAWWTPMSDTTEIPHRLAGFPRTDTTLLPIIEGEVAEPPADPTVEIVFPWPRPAVTRYTTPRARWSRRVRRLRRSRFAADVRDRWGAWLTAVGFLTVVYLLLRLVDLMHTLAPVTAGWN